MSLKVRSILVLIVGGVLGVSLSLGGGLLATRPQFAHPLPLSEGELLAEVMERVKRDYVDPVDDRELVEAAIRGMVAALDPHSQFLDADEYEEIRISTTGNYSGVGIEVSLDAGAVTVVAPFDDTPAARAGILPGDIIVSINGFDVHSERLSEAIARMRGKPGSTVDLLIVRDELDEPLNFRLTRAYVKMVSVRHQLLSERFGYARVSQFSETTARDLRKAVRAMNRENDQRIDGLVLDLRNNPGGVLDSAVDVSDLFLEDGIIVSANGRGADAAFTHAARRGDILKGARLVVLVNEGSASASEIVAGALQDNNRATLVGTATFGKGTVQTVMPLSNGDAIKLTTAHYFTPSGVSIHETGIQPDFVITVDEEAVAVAKSPSPDADAQLGRAVELLRTPYIMHSKAP